MEKDIGRVKKNDSTDIVVRIDEFGGKPGLTVREFTNDARTGYKGFTKSGTRIPADKFLEFRELINSIKLEDLNSSGAGAPTEKKEKPKKEDNSDIEDY